jgi:alpha-tubulin suppressor-like RCC1 family protein
MKPRAAVFWFPLLASPLACSEVAEVLRAAGGSSSSAGMPASGAAGSPHLEGSGGAEPADPSLGVFADSGDAHACAAVHGVLYCWGAGADGRLGNGDTTDRDTPTRVGFAADWLAVATGVAHTCALATDGSVWCFGANNVGQLGQGNNTPSAAPLRVPLPQKTVQLSSEANTACVVLEDGELWCWGRNWEGNIGLNDTHPGVDQLAPIRSGAQSDWKAIGTGDGHSCGVRGSGLLFGWGRNTAANLGLGQTTDQQRRSATQIGSETDWVSVVSGQDSSCGLRQGGSLFCWGGNAFGNLGLGDALPRLVPSPVVPASASVWAQVSIDTFHGCGIDADGSLYCWGRGIEGQLGTGDENDRLAPALVGSGFAQVAVGRMSTCAVTADARVACTGENASGQLGVADKARRNTLTELSFP